MNVALVTNEDFPNLAEGEVRFFDALKARGIPVSCAVWSDASVDWSQFSHVILRLCWDYHLRLEEFLAWVDRLEKAHVNVYNSKEIIRWNTNKSYLLDLQKRGVAIPATRIVSDSNLDEIRGLIEELNAKQIVVKPAVGAAAYKVKRFTHADSRAVSYIKRLLEHSNVLIQAFVPEIKNGEISAIFFNNEFSHAVTKTPQKNDFRSNHNGNITSFVPSEAMKQRLRTVYDQCTVDTLHARIDVVDTGDELVLIELELIDAELFLEYDKEAADRLVDTFLGLANT